MHTAGSSHSRLIRMLLQGHWDGIHQQLLAACNTSCAQNRAMLISHCVIMHLSIYLCFISFTSGEDASFILPDNQGADGLQTA